MIPSLRRTRLRFLRPPTTARRRQSATPSWTEISTNRSTATSLGATTFTPTRALSGLLLPPTKESKKTDSSVSILPGIPSAGVMDNSGPTKGQDKGSNESGGRRRKRVPRKKRDGRTKTSATDKTSKSGAKKTSRPSPNRKKKKGRQNRQRSIEQDLQRWYEEKHDVSFKDKCITLKKVSLSLSVGGGSKWKAQFACPISKETFSGGTLAHMEEANQFWQADGDIVYTRMKHARIAALARALDCLRYRQDEGSAKTRLCVEPPYLIGEEEKIMVPLSDTTEKVTGVLSEDSEENVLSDEDEDGEEDDNEEDEEEYTIQFLKGTAPNDQSFEAGATNPLARVIGSWTDTTAALSHQSDHSTPFLTTHPEQELKQLVENAEVWIAQEQESKPGPTSAHRVMLQTSDFPRSLEIANIMLNGLAKAHRRVGIQTRPRGVESVATKILNHLWSSKSAHPNADTYSAYLGCLEGAEAIMIANRAKEILDAMQEGAAVDVTGEKTLPKPTIAVVNAVIQLWAQVGGESGRSLVLDNIKEKPNRETFLSLLSCMSYPATIDGQTGGFDPIFAQDCIDTMREASLNVDTDAYNAGLRWSGGLLASLSRPYARPIPWNSHAETFQNGFKLFDEDTAEVQEAYRMHTWLEEMENLGCEVAPNIETYEAVIQAYVRTGSINGVLEAEELLDSLLHSPDQTLAPRLQTFHPIIAAWAYSGHKDGPQNVGKWIDRLHALSDSIMQSQEFENHVGEAPLLANVKGVDQLLKSKTTFTAGEIDDMIDTALGCSIHLTDLCFNHKNTTRTEERRPVDPHLFALVIQVWSRLGLHLLSKSNESSDPNKSLEKMMETVEAFEGLILEQQKRNKTQARYLTSNAYKLYSLVLSALSEARTLTRTTDSDWLMAKQIGVLERWVRRMHEYSDFRQKSYKFANAHTDEQVYGDMYSYLDRKTMPMGCAETEAEFLKQILESLRDDFQDPSTSPRRGDLLRLCFLVVDVLPSTNLDLTLANTHETRPFSLVLGYKEAIKTIRHLAIGADEHEALLGRLVYQLDWLEEKGICSMGDHELILKEIKKHSASTPVKRRRRSRRMGRGDAGCTRPPRSPVS